MATLERPEFTQIDNGWRECKRSFHELDLIIQPPARKAKTSAGYTEGKTVIHSDLTGAQHVPWFFRVRDTRTYKFLPNGGRSLTGRRVVTLSYMRLQDAKQVPTETIRNTQMLVQLTAEDARRLGEALIQAADWNLVGRLSD